MRQRIGRQPLLLRISLCGGLAFGLLRDCLAAVQPLRRHCQAALGRGLFDQIIGAQTVEWQGEERTARYMEIVLLDTDRETRRKGWEKLAARHITSFAIDSLPRISRAQKMDALSAMAFTGPTPGVMVSSCKDARSRPKMSPWRSR